MAKNTSNDRKKRKNRSYYEPLTHGFIIPDEIYDSLPISSPKEEGKDKDTVDMKNMENKSIDKNTDSESKNQNNIEMKKEYKNYLILGMSTLNNLANNFYYFKKEDKSDSSKEQDENEYYRFSGVSQLEAGTKYLLNKLKDEGDAKLDRIFVLNTDQSVKNIEGKIKKAYGDIYDKGLKGANSAYEFYKRRICNYIEGVEDKYDPLLTSLREKEDRYLKIKIENIIEEKTHDQNGIKRSFNEKELSVLANNIIEEVKEYYSSQFEIEKLSINNSSIKTEIENLEDEAREDFVNIVQKDWNQQNHMSEIADSLNQYKNQITNYLRQQSDISQWIDMIILWEEYMYEDFRYYLEVGKWRNEVNKVREGYENTTQRLISLEKENMSLQFQNEVIESEMEKKNNIIKILEKHIEDLKNNTEGGIKEYTKKYLYRYCKDNDLLEGKKLNDDTNMVSIINSDYLTGDGKVKVDEDETGFFCSVMIPDSVGINKVSNRIGQAIEELVNNIEEDYSYNVRIYIDNQGGSRAVPYVTGSVISMLERKGINIGGQFLTEFTEGNIANEIVDISRVYETNQLVSGLNAFIRYGRVDEIERYIKNENDDASKKLVDCMIKISDALELSDVKNFENALKELKIAVENEMNDPYMEIIRTTIKDEYRPLIDVGKGRTIDIIKWLNDKRFTAQALTFIEDRMPQYICENFIEYRLQRKNIQNNRWEDVEDRNVVRRYLEGVNYEYRNPNHFVDRSYEKYNKMQNEATREEVNYYYGNNTIDSKETFLKNYIKDRLIKQKLDNYCDELRLKYESCQRNLIDNNSEDIIENFIECREMRNNKWLKEELENGFLAINTSKRRNDKFIMNGGKYRHEFFKRICPNNSFSEYYTNIIDVCINSTDGFKFLYKDKRGNNEEIKLKIKLKENVDENKIKTFMRLHAMIRQERNSSNHASENEERIPRTTITRIINEYVSMAEDIKKSD